MNSQTHHGFISAQGHPLNFEQQPVFLLPNNPVQACIINGTLMQLPIQVMRSVIVDSVLNSSNTSVSFFEQLIEVPNGQVHQTIQNMPYSFPNFVETSLPAQFVNSNQSAQKPLLVPLEPLPNPQPVMDSSISSRNDVMKNVVPFSMPEAPPCEERTSIRKDSIEQETTNNQIPQKPSLHIDQCQNTQKELKKIRKSCPISRQVTKRSNNPDGNSMGTPMKMRNPVVTPSVLQSGEDPVTSDIPPMNYKCHKKLTEDIIIQAVDAVKEGKHSLRDCCRKFEVPFNALQKNALKDNITKPKVTYTEENLQKALTAVREGKYSVRHCSRLFDVSYNTLFKKARNANITTPKERTFTEEDVRKDLAAIHYVNRITSGKKMKHCSRIFNVPYDVLRCRQKRITKPRERKTYSEEVMQNALAAVSEGRATLAEAEKVFGVPGPSIAYRLSHKDSKPRNQNYTEEDMQKALAAVREGRMKIADAERAFGVSQY